MGNTVYCLASSEPQANSILTHLRNLGFSSSEISVVLPAHAETKNISVKEDAIRGAETGGVIGGILGWVAGFSAIALPGIGAFMVAGPIVAALGGAMAGGVVGGLAGGSGAVHLPGLPHDVSNRIESRLKDGDILISVHSDDPVIRERAVGVFKAAGSENIFYHDEQAAA